MGIVISRQLITLKEACDWASSFLGRKISKSNISYLIQYGKVKKYGENDSDDLNASIYNVKPRG